MKPQIFLGGLLTFVLFGICMDIIGFSLFEIIHFSTIFSPGWFLIRLMIFLICFLSLPYLVVMLIQISKYHKPRFIPLKYVLNLCPTSILFILFYYPITYLSFVTTLDIINGTLLNLLTTPFFYATLLLASISGGIFLYHAICFSLFDRGPRETAIWFITIFQKTGILTFFRLGIYGSLLWLSNLLFTIYFPFSIFLAYPLFLFVLSQAITNIQKMLDKSNILPKSF